MHLQRNIRFLSVIALSLMSGLGHTYKINDGSGSGSSHSIRQPEYSEECTKGSDGKDPPLISTNKEWIHTGKKSTITLKCIVCAENPYKVWWTKDNKIIRGSSGSRIRTSSDQKQHKSRNTHRHRKPGHLYKLRIKAFRESDFGLYRCTIFHNKTKMQEGQEIQVSGAPYPPVFETPTTWSETEFVLSWRSNCSIWAPPIIDYQLKFRQSEMPRTSWITVNVPAHETYDVTDTASNLLKETQDANWSDSLYAGNTVDTDQEQGLHHRRSRLYRGINAPKLTVYRQSYALRGLSRATNYECKVRSRNEYGFSAYSDVLYFRTFDFAHQKGKDEFQNTFIKNNNFYDNIIPDTSTENESEYLDIGGFTKEADRLTVKENVDDLELSNSINDRHDDLRKPLATRRSQGYTGYSGAGRTRAKLQFGLEMSLPFVSLIITIIKLIFQ